MTTQNIREIIARRAADELKIGNLVNLGIGMPTMVADYISPEKHIVFQSENGMAGVDATPQAGQEDWHITNSAGAPVTAITGASYFDSALSFSIIRGGHVDATILGAMEVDQEGNLANWIVPNKMVAGMGGAMDLVVGAKKVIIMMEHCNKNGEPKILKKCRLPLTAARQVNLIITELAVIEVTGNGLLLKEISRDTTVETVLKKTEAELMVDKQIKYFGVSNEESND
jgi:acetate CoA/acetoacetate CoA-transferase beta subunit